MTPPKCSCGVYAVGECVRCDQPLCAEHGVRFEDRFFCTPHRRAAEEDAERTAIERDERRSARKAAAAERSQRTSQFRAALGDTATRLTDRQIRAWMGLDLSPAEIDDWMDVIADDDAIAWAKSGVPCSAAPRYRAAGFSPRSARSWWRHNIEPDDARLLHGAGLAPAASAAWLDATGDAGAGPVLRWLETGLPRSTAQSWSSAPVLGVQEQIEWARSEFAVEDVWDGLEHLDGPADLRRWVRAGFSVAQAVQYLDDGIRLQDARQWLSPQHEWGEAECREWRDLGLDLDEAAKWRSAGFGPADARDWLRQGFARSRAVQYHAMGLTPDEVLRKLHES